MNRDKKWVRQMSSEALKKYAADNDDYDIKHEMKRREKRRAKYGTA